MELRNIVFDVGGVLLQNGTRKFVEETITYKEDAPIIDKELFQSDERNQLDRGIIEKKEAFEEAKAAASKKSKKKAKKEEEEEDEEEEAQHYTSEEIEALGTKQLKVIAAEIGLELDDEASTRSKRRSVIAGLRKAGLLDED